MAEAVKMKDQTIRGGGEGNGPGAIEKLGEHPRRLRQFLHEVRVEMDKVSWPSWQDVRSTTIVVIITVALFGFYFLGTDLVAQRFVSWLIDIGKKL
ncbi:MAG TPA: preprotein translocase subunit SecE [Candidatus Acidoferrales bacterium]|nr:preprotein translocase subunit SecE [Candidatus Acidoferrales bacterium]